jgi:hypothetical protein
VRVASGTAKAAAKQIAYEHVLPILRQHDVEDVPFHIANPSGDWLATGLEC